MATIGRVTHRKLAKVRNLLLRWLVLAAAVATAAWLVPGIRIDGGAAELLLVAAIVGLLNAIVGPVLRILSLPFIIVTLGLFLLVVNAVLFLLAAELVDALQVDGFGAAVLGGLVVSVTAMVLEPLTAPFRKD